jgi:hypothetical protein
LAVVPVINDFATKWAEEQEITKDPSKKVSWMIDHISPLVHSWGFAVALGALGGATAALWLFRLWLKPAPNKRATGDVSQLQKVYKASFRNETIDIDGKEFIDCIFETVTLRYMGGDFNIGHSIFKGSIGVASDDRSVEATIQLIAAINLAKKEVDGRGVTRFTNVLAISEDAGTPPVLVTQSESPVPRLPTGSGKEKQRYQGAVLDKRIEEYLSIFEILQIGFERGRYLAGEAVNNWPKALSTLGPKAYADQLTELQTVVSDAFVETGRVLNKYEYNQDIQQMMRTRFQVQGNIFGPINGLLEAVLALPDDAPARTIQLAQPHFESFRKAVHTMALWIDETKEIISDAIADESQSRD